MKRRNITLEEIKQRLLDLKGRQVFITNNKGRNKTESYSAFIESLYPAVFTIKNNEFSKTFSYSDVLCGNIKIDNL